MCEHTHGDTHVPASISIQWILLVLKILNFTKIIWGHELIDSNTGKSFLTRLLFEDDNILFNSRLMEPIYAVEIMKNSTIFCTVERYHIQT